MTCEYSNKCPLRQGFKCSPEVDNLFRLINCVRYNQYKDADIVSQTLKKLDESKLEREVLGDGLDGWNH